MKITIKLPSIKGWLTKRENSRIDNLEHADEHDKLQFKQWAEHNVDRTARGFNRYVGLLCFAILLVLLAI